MVARLNVTAPFCHTKSLQLCFPFSILEIRDLRHELRRNYLEHIVQFFKLRLSESAFETLKNFVHIRILNIQILQILVGHFKEIFTFVLLRPDFSFLFFANQIVDFVGCVGLRNFNKVREFVDRRTSHCINHFHAECLDCRQSSLPYSPVAKDLSVKMQFELRINGLKVAFK